MASRDKNMNPTHQVFIAAMARNHWKIKPSAEEAGIEYSSARHLAARTHIRQQIQRQIDKVTTRLEVEHEDIIRGYQEIIDYDPSMLLDENGQDIPLQELPPEIRRCIGVTQRDRKGALDSLAKLQGFMVEKTQVTHSFAQMLDSLPDDADTLVQD